MEPGFPPMEIIINIMFFVVVALFLILAAKTIMERSEPEFVISALLPFSYLGLHRGLCRGRKGFSSLVIFIILAVVVFAVLLLLFFVFKGDIIAMANSIAGGILDAIPFL